MGRASFKGAGLPTASGKVTSWLRLNASTPVSSEWETVQDVLNPSNPVVQTDSDRKPATATSANGLPLATFDGTDVWLQTLSSATNATAKWWIHARVKVPDFAASQTIYAVMVATGASSNRFRLIINGSTGAILVDIFVSGFNGRRYTSTATLTAASFGTVYVQFDNSKTNECDTTGSDTDSKLRLFIGNTASALTAVDQGTGGVPSALLAATGTAVFGGANDVDAPVSPLRNGSQFGPNPVFFGQLPLTAQELANLNSFEIPT